PTVRTYQRQITTAPIPDVRRGSLPIGQVQTPIVRAAPTPDTYGAQVGETLMHLGEQFYQQHQEMEFRNDQLGAEAGARQMAQWELDRVDHPEQGLFATVRGKDAKNLLTVVPDEFEQARSKVWGGLENDRQRQMFEQLADQQSLQLQRKTGHFVAAEQENYAITEVQAG